MREQCAVINMNEYWNASPLRQKSGSNIVTVTSAFSFCLYSLLSPKSLLMRILAKTGILTHISVYVIVQSRQKRKSMLLSHRKRRRTHIALLFEFQRLKIGCFKTAVLNAWACYRCSPSFSNELLVVSWLVVLSPLHTPTGRRIKIAVTQIMKRYYLK